MSDDFTTEPIPEPGTSAEPTAQAPASEEPSAAPTPGEPAAAPSPGSPNPSEAWADVVARMGQLGDAMSAWAKAATDSPENRRRLDDVRSSMNDIAGKADEAFTRVTGSEVGTHVKASATEAGQAIGAAAGAAGRAAAPVVVTTFSSIAEFFGTAAERVEEAARRSAAAGEAPVPEPTVPTAETPVAPVVPEPPIESQHPAPPAPPEVGE